VYQPVFTERVEEETLGDPLERAAFSYTRSELLQYRERPSTLPGEGLPRYSVTASASPEKIMGANLLQTLKRKEKKTGRATGRRDAKPPRVAA
jgi:hypothetical protein